MLVDGTEIESGSQGKNSCYIPIMKQEFGDQKSQMTVTYQNTWIVGTQVMNKYYTVFDQRKELKKPNILIGLKNPDFNPGNQIEEEEEEELNRYVLVGSIALGFLTLICIAICCLKKLAKRDD